MKSAIIICTIFLLLSGCKRSSELANEPSSAATSIDSSASAPGQALALLEKGKQLYREDNDAEAAEAFRQAIQLDPELSEAHFRLGLTYEALDKAEEAEAEYKKAVESYNHYLTEHPDDFEAHYNLGQAYANLHRYSDAIREYRQAIKFKDGDADIYFDLGMAHTRLAQYGEAVAAFTKSLEIDPNNYRAEDALSDAREGVKRIRTGKKHQAALLKKQKEEELKKAESGIVPAAGSSKPTP